MSRLLLFATIIPLLSGISHLAKATYFEYTADVLP